MNPNRYFSHAARRTQQILGLFFIIMGLSGPAEAGWAVAPIRVELSAQSRTETVSISNDGDAAVAFDIEARRWTQESAGQDHYTATDDLVLFPRVMSVPPGETRVIRIGIKVPAGPVEKTYRVFIKEKLRGKTTPGNNVTILVNFGVPVFSLPATPQPAAEVVSFGVRDGVLAASLRNAGNVHLQFKSIAFRGFDAVGTELFSGKADGGYLLSGSQRSFPMRFPTEACPKLSRVTATFHSDTLELEQSTGTDAALCSQ